MTPPVTEPGQKLAPLEFVGVAAILLAVVIAFMGVRELVGAVRILARSDSFDRAEARRRLALPAKELGAAAVLWVVGTALA